MTDHADTFSKRILARRKVLADRLSENPLRIAVLGPSLNDISNSGTRKRRQIADSLEDDGHETFFPEQYVLKDDPSVPWVEQERQLLSDSAVDFVVILHTEDSAGVLVEIGNFVSVPEISFKTGVSIPFPILQANAEPAGKHGPSVLYKNAIHGRTFGVMRASR